MPFPSLGPCLRPLCFPLDLPFQPILLLCLCSYSKSPVTGTCPQAGTGQQGSWPPSLLLTGANGSRQLPLSPSKAGKRRVNTSHKELQLPRSHTNTPLGSCRGQKAASQTAPPLFLPSLQDTVAPKSPVSQSGVGLLASLQSCLAPQQTASWP